MTFAHLSHEVAARGFEFGTVPMDPEVARSLGAMGVSAEMLAAYSPVGPAPRSSIPWVVEELFVYSLTELGAAWQEYAEEPPSGDEGRRFPGWPFRGRAPRWGTAWFVVASAQGDPFFVDVSRPGSPVFAALHGEGRWAPKQIAGSLGQFVDALTVFERVLLGEFDLDVWDESDGELRKDFRASVTRSLAPILARKQIAAFVAMLE